MGLAAGGPPWWIWPRKSLQFIDSITIEVIIIDFIDIIGSVIIIIGIFTIELTVTVIIFWGLWIWNDFMQAFIVMGTSRGQLAFVQLWRFLSDQYVKNWNTIFAGVVVLSLPITALYFVMQRRFIQGLTAGAIK